MNANTGEIHYVQNPNGFVPSQGIVIYKSGDKLFARYPTGKSLEIDDTEKTLSELKRCGGLIECKSGIIKNRVGNLLGKGEYGFIINDEHVLIGEHEEIVIELKNLLSRSDLSGDSKVLIQEFIVANQ